MFFPCCCCRKDHRPNVSGNVSGEAPLRDALRTVDIKKIREALFQKGACDSADAICDAIAREYEYSEASAKEVKALAAALKREERRGGWEAFLVTTCLGVALN